MKFLTRVGLACTAVYSIGAIAIVVSNWNSFVPLSPNEWGDFLAGCFGPLAIFWLVLGYFQQGEELRNSVDALKLQTQELQSSVQQQEKIAVATQQQLKIDEMMLRERAQRLIESECPFIVLVGGGGSSASGGKVSTRFFVKNRGGDARNLSIDFTPDQESSQRYVQSLEGKDQIEIVVTSGAALSAPGSPLFCAITSYSLNGHKREQHFKIVGSEIVEVSNRITQLDETKNSSQEASSCGQSPL